MELTFTDEQILLRESADRFLERDYGFDKRQRIAASEGGTDPAVWQQFAELGWLALPIGEENMGLGGSMVDLALLMEAFGRGLVVEPYLSSVVLGAGLIEAAGTKDQKDYFLPQIANGDLKIAVAMAEPESRYDLHRIATTARRAGDDWQLNGKKGVVLDAPGADKLIVPARTAGSNGGRGGITLFLFDRNSEGVILTSSATGDGRRAAEIEFSNVTVGAGAVLGTVDDGLAHLDLIADRACIALAAEAAGAMTVLIDATRDYLGAREQFGGAIGRFQVLQHRLVDMFAEKEMAWSMVLRAAASFPDSSSDERAMLASAAKARAGKAGAFVGQQAVQLHGGIGMTAELPVGHYFKRLTLIDATLGNVAYHQQRFAALKDEAPV